MLELAVSIGDAVSIGTGLAPEVVAWLLGQVARGARQRGRDPAAVEPWFTVRSVLDADRDASLDAARDRTLPSLASSLHHSMRHGSEDRLVPERHRDAVPEYVRHYTSADHQRPGGANEKLLHRLGLAEFAPSAGSRPELRPTGSDVSGISPTAGSAGYGWPTAAVSVNSSEHYGRSGEQVLPRVR